MKKGYLERGIPGACRVWSAAGEAGFTLLELLIAISLLAIMVGILSSGFNLSIRAWEAGSEKLENHYGVNESMALLVRQLKMARQAHVIDEKTFERGMAFKGDTVSVIFITASPAFMPQEEARGLYKQEVKFEPDTRSILVKETEFDPWKRLGELEGREYRIGEGKIKNLNFLYYVKMIVPVKGGKKAEKWVWRGMADYERRKDENGMPVIAEDDILDFFPRGMKMRVELAGGEEEEHGFVWPEQIIQFYNGHETRMMEREAQDMEDETLE